jgi:ribonuclease HII
MGREVYQNYLRSMSQLQSYFQKERLEAGCDEAGRGCLAGPVVAAAVILPKGWSHELLNDSKKLTEKQREEVRKAILHSVEDYAVGICDHEEIDEINILNASFLAMHRALDQIGKVPDCILVDGNRFTPYRSVKYECIVGGDGLFKSIAAASVLAKTERDDLMKKLHTDFPQYGWDTNKGYPTKAHREAISEHGPSPFHRKSFTLLPKQLDFRL